MYLCMAHVNTNWHIRLLSKSFDQTSKKQLIIKIFEMIDYLKVYTNNIVILMTLTTITLTVHTM